RGVLLTRPPPRGWICFPRVLIERYRAHKEGIKKKLEGGFSWREAVVEGRGRKRQSDSFSGNKAGFVSLGRPPKNSVSPQGAKVAEANVSQRRLGVAELPRRAEASSLSRQNISSARWRLAIRFHDLWIGV